MARVSAHKETAFNRLVLVAITALCLLFVFLMSRTFIGSDKIAIANPSTPTASIARAHQLELDSDGDGVPDWEELLYGSDPYDPNSIPVVSTGKNPSIAGKTKPEAHTATDAVAHELMGTLMTEYKKKGGPNIQKVADHALGSLSDFTGTLSTLTFDTIKTVPSSKEAKETYLTSLEDIFKKTADMAAAEYHALTMIVQGSKKEGVTMLTKSKDAYAFYIEQVMLLSVPEDALTMHKELVSSVERYRIACENLTKIESDPVLAMLGISDFLPSQLHMTDQLRKMAHYRSTYYESLGMVFVKPADEGPTRLPILRVTE